MSKANKPPMSISKLGDYMKGKVRRQGAQAVVPGPMKGAGGGAVDAGSAPTLAMATLRFFQEDKIAVVVASITDDVRLYEVPKLRVCALRFTETARARIIKVRRLGEHARSRQRTGMAHGAWCWRVTRAACRL
jgi:ribosomal protein L18E